MAQALVDKYSKEELEAIVKSSNSIRDVVRKLGYGTVGGSNSATVKNRIEKYAIDISHFSPVNGIERKEENVFVENSTATQATLRRWYLKGEYAEYKCSICGQEPEWQGKPLTLILDHINGHNNDHRLQNLRWVCPNCNQQLETTGYKKMRVHEELSKKYYCIDCGKEISHGAERCPECAGKARRIATKEITREELKNLIRTQSFVKIGEYYGMSDNAIRKWCDKFKLPRTKTEIQNYTDKEWELI